MYCIVPLAGPDIYLPDGMLKPFVPVGETSLLEATLKARAWYISGELSNDHIIFVVRQHPQLDGLVSTLETVFPGCRTVVVDGLTRGALMSAVAGTALLDALDEPLAIDLADIGYTLDLSPTTCFAADASLAGIIPCFESDDPKYSYVRLDEENNVVEAAEKKVISNLATAGTYFFRNVATFLSAVSGALAAGDCHTYKGNFFVCPAYNTLIEGGRSVSSIGVVNVGEWSLDFHIAKR